MRGLTIAILSLSLVLGAVAVGRPSVAVSRPQTEIQTGAMLGNGRDPHAFYTRTQGGTWQLTYPGQPVAGRLMNFRAANAIFDDELRTDDNPSANTQAFIDQFDNYHAHGILAMTVSLQGGNPGYSGAVATAFRSDGTLKTAWLERAGQVIEAADQRGMVIVLTYFYQYQDQVLTDSAAVRNAVINATDWLIANNYRNVIIEIANEHRNAQFEFDLIRKNLTVGGIGELIRLAQSRFDGKDWRVPVSATTERMSQFNGALAEVSDVALVHGGYARDWEGTIDTYQEMRAIYDARAMPVMMTEDNNSHEVANQTSLSRDVHALDDALRAGGSWGLMWRPYNQLFPMQWSLGNAQHVTDQAGYFHAVLDQFQERTGTPTPPTATTVATATETASATATATATESPTPDATETAVPGEFQILYSLSRNRSNPQALSGTVVTGNIHVFTSPDTEVNDVIFSLDGVVVRTEDTAPFDFNGGSSRSATPWRTTDVSPGTHTISAVFIMNDGSQQTASAVFIVAN